MAAKKANGKGTALAAEQLTKRTRLEFGGRAYNLVMTNGALIEFESLTGVSALMDGEKIFTKPTLGMICAMTYVLIKRDGSTLTHEQVIEMMTIRKTSQAFRAILAARLASVAKEEEQDPHTPTVSVSA
jgi:hypothetical protein